MNEESSRTIFDENLKFLSRHFSWIEHRAIIIESPTKSAGRKMREKSLRAAQASTSCALVHVTTDWIQV